MDTSNPEKEPLILAFDTSGGYCAAAVSRGEQVLAEAFEPMARGQAERLMQLCAELMQSATLSPSALDAIGVGIGPGNFTGIRIAVSAARGMALGLGVPAIGVSNFDALRLGVDGPCACAVDARREQVYLQLFEQEAQREPQIFPVAELPEFDGPLIGVSGQPPVYKTASAIARITALRYLTPAPRPAPLYLRPADAAPARDTAPPLLT